MIFLQFSHRFREIDRPSNLLLFERCLDSLTFHREEEYLPLDCEEDWQDQEYLPPCIVPSVIRDSLNEFVIKRGSNLQTRITT
jgi:hypothetical protein